MKRKAERWVACAWDGKRPCRRMTRASGKRPLCSEHRRTVALRGTGPGRAYTPPKGMKLVPCSRPACPRRAQVPIGFEEPALCNGHRKRERPAPAPKPKEAKRPTLGDLERLELDRLERTERIGILALEAYVNRAIRESLIEPPRGEVFS